VRQTAELAALDREREEAMAEFFEVKTSKPKQNLDVTPQVADIVQRSGVRRGLCHVMVLHATAAIVVNENDDPNIRVDLITALDGAVPDHAGWLHDRIDDNAQAHIKAAILGPSETIPVEQGKLVLGTWQGIMLIELDGPGPSRRIAVQILPSG
jgi:secondary thiamine-phosphate synthase enzyme